MNGQHPCEEVGHDHKAVTAGVQGGGVMTTRL